MEFKHIPIMLNECIDGLDIKPDGIYVDGTLGGAGHSSKILEKLTTGKLIGIDKDSEALVNSQERLSKINENFILVHDDFKNFQSILKSLKIEKVDGVLLDLGVSSYQLDNSERGFSYRSNARLDMRMNQEQKLSAYEVVNNYSEADLIRILYEYGEESFAKRIVSNIAKARKIKKIETTMELVEIIESSFPKKMLYKGGSVCKKTFQAIRIEVNGELNKLGQVLGEMIDALNVNGRICVITFHSLEDRIVKQVFKERATECICPPSALICVCNHHQSIELINRKPIIPSDEEMNINTRSQSSKLRIARKII